MSSWLLQRFEVEGVLFRFGRTYVGFWGIACSRLVCTSASVTGAENLDLRGVSPPQASVVGASSVASILNVQADATDTSKSWSALVAPVSGFWR